ncbi:MAG: hypothetical protein AAB429_00535 [Patescibacteria group bacterium]
MNYLTEEKFEKEIKALRLREFASFKDEMMDFRWKNNQEHTELKGMITGVQTTVDKIYHLLDRDTHKMEQIDLDLVTTHVRLDRVEKYLGPGFAQAVVNE